MASTTLPVHVVDPDGIITFVNDAMARCMGFERSEVVGRSIREFLTVDAPDSADSILRPLSHQDSLTLPVILTNRDGTELLGDEHLVASRDEAGYLVAATGIFTNVTERRPRWQETVSTLERFRQITEQSPAVYELYDATGLQVEVNRAYERLWGFERAWTVGSFNVLESQEVADRGLLPYLKRAYAGESLQIPPYEFDARGPTEGRGLGRVAWLDSQIHPITDPEGRVTHVVVMHQDVTETHEAMAALAEREERFRDLFENSLDSICILDVDKNYVEVNRATEALTGYSREEMLRMNVADMVHPEDRANSKRHFKELDESGFYNTYEGRIVTKSGETRYVEVSSNVILRNGEAVGSRDFLRDVTARKEAEQARKDLEHQLFLSQKMESVGRLAGGIAHDFNNILASVMGYSELLHESFPDKDSPEGEAAAGILKGVGRASDLTQQLLGFARRGRYQPVPLDVNETVREVVGMSGKIFEGRIRVDFDLEPGLPPVEADRSQLDQVITNLVINAGDAMPHGGDLLIRTAHVLAPPVGMTPPESPRGWVRISVGDTGVGMSPDVLDRIFEPFFSTKPRHGTGLGLATVYGIVQNHKGAILATSEPGVGTTFDILLPAGEGTPMGAVAESTAVGGTGTILVIDDEPGVRKVLARHLEALGYEVVQASGGAEGVDLYRTGGGSLDLVLLDMVMPHMDGEATFKALKELDAGVRVVLTSGFSEDGRANRILSQGTVGFLQKPFRRAALANLVRDALAR
jgi:PAS domain S-box-containing protein